MHVQRKRLLFGFVVALLAVFLFVGTASADDGSGTTVVSDETAISADGSASALSESDAVSEGASEEVDPQTVADDPGSTATVIRDSGEVVVEGDPYFSVGSVTYHFAADCTGIDNCVPSATPISEALDYMAANNLTPSDRKLYVEADEYNEDVEVDGTLAGVSGLTGLVGAGSSDTIINGDVAVHDEVAGFTVSGFSVNGGVSFINNTGTVTLDDLDVENVSGSGIVIFNQAGAVNVKNVESSNNYDFGAWITTSSTAVYPITITNSEFDDNGNPGNQMNSGVVLGSKGNIVVTGISASRNTGTGLSITTPAAFTLTNAVLNGNHSTSGRDYDGNGLFVEDYGSGAITLTNVQAEDNSNDGLILSSYGTVKLTQVSAMSNGMTGAYIGYEMNPYPTSVAIYDSQFDGNGGSGLYVNSLKNILLSFVSADGNSGGYGAYLDNCQADLGGYCTGSGTVTLLNPQGFAATFNDNGADGLRIFSGGAVTITGVSTGGNHGDGLLVVNSYPGKTAGVTINNILPAVAMETSDFSFNDGAGVVVYTNGTATVNGQASNPITINGNWGPGLYIQNDSGTSAGVTIKYVNTAGDAWGDSMFSSVFVQSKGTIALTGVTSDSYYDYDTYDYYSPAGNGFTLDNSTGAGSVIVNGSASYDAGGYGYEISTHGAVTLTNIDAYWNGLGGAYIDNCDYDDVSGTCAGAAAVNILAGSNDYNYFNYNGGDGLFISTIGNVTINKTSAYENDGSGIYIEAPDALTTIPGGNNVKITNGGSVGGGEEYGFYIFNYGTVSIQGGYSYYSGDTGYYIDNSNAASAKAVILSNINAQNAGGDGVYVLTKGAVTINGVSAYNNTGDGLYIDNKLGTGNVTVNLYKGSGYSSSNYLEGNDNGLIILTYGVVTLTGVYANENAYNGIYIDNLGVAGKAVKLTSVNASNNGMEGLFIFSRGAITLVNTSGMGNGDTGAVLINETSLTPMAVSVTDSVFDYNTYGLFIASKGNVSLMGVEAENNFIRQYDLGTLTVGKTISSYLGARTANYCSSSYCYDTDSASASWTFTLNASTDLSIVMDTQFDGWVTIYDENGFYVDDFSFGYGTSDPYLVGTLPAGSYTVVIQKDEYYSSGNYSLSLNDDSQSNMQWFSTYGITVDNTAGSGSVTVGKGKSWTDNYLDYNSGNGLTVRSKGNVALTNIYAYDNQDTGVLVDNTYGTGTVTITSANVSYFSWNGETGLEVHSNNAIKVNATQSLYANGNGSNGMTLINNGDGVTAGITITGKYDPSINLGNIDLSWNSNDGIYAQSNGPVVINYVHGEGDWGYGLEVGMNGSLSNPKSVAISNAQFNEGNAGLLIYSEGAVTLMKVTTSDNLGSGIDIEDATIVSAKKIIARNNEGEGLYIWAQGNVLLDSVDISYNHDDFIGTYVASDSGSITLLSSSFTNRFDGNDGAGAYFIANSGLVTLNRFTANGNGQDGLIIYSSGKLTVNQGVTNDNGEQGLYAEAYNGVAINGLTSYSNGTGTDGNGLDLYAYAGTISIANSAFINNEGSGIWMLNDTGTTPVLTNTFYFGNDSDNDGDPNIFFAH